MLREALADQLEDWRSECAEVRAAHACWSHAPAGSRERAYGAYLCALEREEQASRVYHELLEQLRGLVCSAQHGDRDPQAARLDLAAHGAGGAGGAGGAEGRE